MAKLINLDRFSAIKQSSHIEQICQPLKLFGITYFNHIRIYKDRSRLSFANNPNWLKLFFDEALYNQGRYSKNPFKHQNGYYLWNALPQDNVANIASEFFDIDNGMTIVETYLSYTDFYLFASTKGNRTINNFYINNLDLLAHFIEYYKEKSHGLIGSCKPDIWLEEDDKYLTTEGQNTICFEDIKKEYLGGTKIKKYYFSHNDQEVALSRRQMQCIKLLLMGYSIKEIARQLQITTRTCQFYIENTREKFHFHSKKELLETFRKLLIDKLPLG